MSVKKPVISQRLKVLIDRMESSMSLPNRVMRAKSSGSSYSVGWQWVNTKPVKSSLIYLYQLTKHNGSYPTLGISFEFYDKHEFRVPKPLHEQKVCFSLCLDSKNPDKLIEYSKPLDLVQAKTVLKELCKQADLLKQTNPSAKMLYANQIISLIRTVAFGYTDKSLNLDKEKILKEFNGDINRALELKDSFTKSTSDLIQARNSRNRDLHESDEYKKVKDLEKQLQEARTALKLKDKEICENHKIHKLQDLDTSNCEGYRRSKTTIYQNVREYMGKNGISFTLMTVIEDLLGKEEQ